MAQRRFVIIGDGAAGLSAAAELREADATASIGVFTDDPSPGYFRAALTNYLLGELREDQLWATSPDFYDRLGIRRVFGRVVGVDTQRSVVWDSTSPTPTPYDHLLIASGARPRAPSFEGSHLPGVMTLRTIQDARQVVDHVRLRRLKRAVVLGGGALGLEWAHALREHGVEVTLVELAPRLLPQALDEVASDLLAARLRQAGIQVLLGEQVTAALPGPEGAVRAVVTSGGKTLECGLVAGALGVVPCSEFLKGSGITLSERGAVVANKRMATNVANVWTAGDVASVDGVSLQLWEPARRQAHVAANNMLGRPSEYAPGVHYFATRLFDLDFARLGRIERAEGRELMVDFPRGTGTIAYRKLALEGGRLVGALMIGERSARVRASGRPYKRLIDRGVDVTSIREKLLDASFDFEGWLRTQKLFEKPVTQLHAAVPVKAAKLRGTQVVSFGGGAGLPETPARLATGGGGGTSVLVRGTSLLRLATSVLEPAPVSVSSPASAAPSTLASPRGSTRVLSIGLHAEAPAPSAVQAAPLDAWLEGLARPVRIDKPAVAIGQSPDSDVVVAHPSVASLHAQILRHGDALYLRDAGSRTGTWVNGRLLSLPHALADGDRLRIGPAELVLRAPSLARAVAPEQAGVAADLQLEVRSGQGVGLSFALRGTNVLVGSAPGAGVELRDLSVAPEHARVSKNGEQMVVTDLGSGRGTFVQGVPLAAHTQALLPEGGWLRVGAVDLVLARGAVLTASLLRPRARLRIDAGPGTGGSVPVTERALVGSDPQSSLVVPGLATTHLEIVLRGRGFVAHDHSGGRSFKSGAPLGADYVELSHGDVLLLGSGTMLRFEESP